MANNKRENKIEKFTKEAIGKTLNQFNKEIGMADLVEINKNQDRILNGILSQVNDESTEKTEKSNIITLDNSTDGIVELKEIQGDTNVNVSKIEEDMPITYDMGEKEGNIFSLNEVNQDIINIGEIKGNTLVNCNKDDKKELVLMKDLSTQGDNKIDITEGVDGGLIDVYLEGNTLVNVSKTKEETLITYEGEDDTTGNHIALVDDGYIRPVLNGKTMVNVCDQKDSIVVTKAYTVENSGNHIALQGDVDGSCRPVITGNTLVNLVQSPNFDDMSKWTSAGEPTINDGIVNFSSTISLTKYIYQTIPTKNNTTYTFMAKAKFNHNYDTKPSPDLRICVESRDGDSYKSASANVYKANNGVDEFKTLKCTFTTGQHNSAIFMMKADGVIGDMSFTEPIILEGDYTDKPIPDYFEGLQSSFEDNLVTQEMVDSGEEEESNLGKYRVDYKVTGKNKANDNNGYTMVTWSGYHENHKVCDLDLEVGKTYTVSCTANPEITHSQGYRVNVLGVKNSTEIQIIQIGYKPGDDRVPQVGTFTLDTKYDSYYISAYDFSNSGCVLRFQLEEGDTATSYEPYKEYTKTLYLNSPLLEGDTIEEKDGGIYHVHRYKETVLDGRYNWSQHNQIGNTNIYQRYVNTRKFSDMKRSSNYTNTMKSDKIKIAEHYQVEEAEVLTGYPDSSAYPNVNWIYMLTTKSNDELKTYFTENPVTVVYELATPQYELIEQSNLVIPSYTNGYLDFDTVIPVEKVEFKSFSEELTYLYPATSYTVQFISDKETTVNISLGGTSLLAQNIVVGLNRISITTPKTLADNKLIISGAEARISKVVVTDTDKEFEYFEGMKSVGENGLKIYSGKPRRFGKGGRI